MALCERLQFVLMLKLEGSLTLLRKNQHGRFFLDPMLALVAELEYILEYPVPSKGGDGDDCRAVQLLSPSPIPMLWPSPSLSPL